MKNLNKPGVLSGMILLAGIILYSFNTGKQPDGQLHLIKLKNPQQLQKLLHYTGEPLPMVSAHRGGAKEGYPENCLATFENTLKFTYSFMECDPRFTKDSAVVLLHDPSLRRTTTGEGPLIDFTLEEVKKMKLKDSQGNVTDYQIPTLDEALEWAKGKSVLVLDSKDVPVALRIKKAEEHKAVQNIVMIVYSFEEARRCYDLNKYVMMEVMVPNIEQAVEFEKTGVPWKNVIAFVGHNLPANKELYDFLHQRGVMCLAGSSRNVDRKYLTNIAKDFSTLKSEYDQFFTIGIDLIETDVPGELGSLLFTEPPSPSKKSKFFR